MSGKSIWSSITRLLGGERSTFGTGGTEYTCPKGHPMDPSWTSCPRCEAESRAQERSSADAGSQSFSENIERRPTMSHDTMISSEDTPRPGHHGTRVDTGEETAPPVARRATPRRKITGVLVSFTWDSQGELFVLYEGRNVIGKGYVESEGGRPCDVMMSTDNTMSNEHAVILCRAGRYELFDRQSTNGTFVDDKFVESRGIELKDGAKIKTGATVWLIRKIESDSSGVVAEPMRHDHPRDEPDDQPNVRDPSRVR